MYHKCSVCWKPILPTDIYTIIDKEGNKVEKQNIPIEAKNLPTGFVHLKCKIKYDEQIIGTSRVTENLEQKMNDLLGK